MGIYISAGRIIIGDGRVVADAALRIEEGTIVKVGPTESVQSVEGDREYVLPEYTVLPGLIDAHVHIAYRGGHRSKGANMTEITPSERVIRTVRNARRTVENGVTTVRDLGSPADAAMAVRDAINKGVFAGPRILTSGEGLTTTGGHGDWVPWHVARHLDAAGGGVGSKGIVADGIPAVTRAVREQLKRGADLVKVWASGGLTDAEAEASTAFSQRELDAIVAEADRHGVDVAAHAHNPASIQQATSAGVRSVEHAAFMDADSIDRMAGAGVFLVPTLTSVNNVATRGWYSEEVQELAEAAYENQLARLPTVHDAGIPVAMGTDAGSSAAVHGENARELELLVNAGFDPHETIEIATTESAELLGLGETVGQIQPSFAADLIAVTTNPLDDVAVLQDPDAIQLVVTRGRPVKDHLR